MRQSVPHAAAPDGSRPDERRASGGDRRRGARGGRRTSDIAGRCPTVIVAEKYAVVRQAITRYLNIFNFDVREATNDVDLNMLMNAVEPGIVILDANLLRSGNGTSRAEIVRRFKPGVPVIMTRSAPLEEAQEDVTVTPATDLAKPFNLSTLLEAIRRALRTES